MIVLTKLNFIISINIEGSRYNNFGTFKRRSSEEAIYCFHGSVCLQEGDTFESFKVLPI